TRLYVACNHSDELMVLDAGTLDLVKAIRAGHGAYNVEPSPDGKWVIVTNKKDQSVSLIDAATLAEVARIPTTKPFPHGVAYSPDSRYAFISQESKGVDPGAVNVIDLQTKTSVASVAVPLQPTGIPILRRSRPTPPPWPCRRGAASGSGHGDRRLGPGSARGGADDDDRGLEAPRAHGGVEAAQCARGGLRREVQGGAGAGRIDHTRRTRRRRQLPLHRSPGASTAGAMRSLTPALTTLAVGFLALDALLFLYSGLSLGRPGLLVSGAAC